ncbi:MAG: DUF3499 domain-containing protein [Corynebacterium sp.]|nr:DUF3499 domain-containing protein [Corynebacterium sp.]
MNQIRRCSRPGCGKEAVATLTYAYAHSTAVIGPLVANDDPHSWDLCEYHAGKITAPLGWELVRLESQDLEDDDLTALAEAVREAGQAATGLVDPHEQAQQRHPAQRRTSARRSHLHVVPDLQEEDSQD